MMEAAWRAPARTGARPDWMQPWMEPFARTIEDHSSRLLSEIPDHARIVYFWRVIKAARALTNQLVQLADIQTRLTIVLP